MTPDILDIAVAAIVLISGALALARGFVREVLSVGAWVGAALATLYLFPFAQPVARTYITVELIADIAAGVALFVVTLIALSLISHALSRRIRESALGPVDRSLGLLFGLVRGALVVSALALGLDYLWPPPTLPPPEIANAISYPMANKGANLLRSLIPASLLDNAQQTAAGVQQQGQMAVDLGRASGTAPT